MKGSGTAPTKYSSSASSRIDGANGRNRSRNLIRVLMMSRMSARRGSARMLRVPSARAPPSHRPSNHPDAAAGGNRRGGPVVERRLVGPGAAPAALPGDEFLLRVERRHD